MKQKTVVTRDTVVRRTQDIVSSAIDGETVMMSIQKGYYYGMDEIGSRIWELLETSIPVSELCGQLMREYDVEEARCERETLDFLNELAEDDLIELL